MLACVPGEHHELGLLAFGVALSRRGWRITYLGTNSPIDAIADVTRSLRPAVVVLVSMNPDNFLDHAREIADLAAQVQSRSPVPAPHPRSPNLQRRACWTKTR